MFDLKVINSILEQMEEERGIPKERVIDAIEAALSTAYKKEYGKKGQIIRAKFDINTGGVEFFQVKMAVDDSKVFLTPEDKEKADTLSTQEKTGEEQPDEKVLFNPEHHILLEDAKRIKNDIEVGEELIFPLENKGDYGRISSQTAKQVIIQKIREAEKTSVLSEFGQREGEIVSGVVQRVERGNIFIDMGRATGILPYDEQIPGERFRQGERIRAYLDKVEETPKGVFLRLSRSHPKFVERLFELEAPEISNGTVEIKAVAREPRSRTKIAVYSHDEHIDPVGSMVGQRGVRVSTVMSELGGEKIDIIEWSEDPKRFIEESISPAKALSVEIIDEKEKYARVEVAEDQQSLAIGKGGQNVRLAARLTGWRIDIQSTKGESVAEADGENVEIKEDLTRETKEEDENQTSPDQKTETTK